MPDNRLEPLRLGVSDAGEVLTLKRAAYLTEGQAHADLMLPPLTQTLDDLRAELADQRCLAWGFRESSRLVASVRPRLIADATAELGRLAVAPDRQGNGLGTSLLLAAEQLLPDKITTVLLFTGERSVANIRLYHRLGYRETGRTTAGCYSLVHMAKTRAPPAHGGGASRNPDEQMTQLLQLGAGDGPTGLGPTADHRKEERGR